jgi:hypothetical protein
MEMLERALRKHRMDVWGTGPVTHPSDVELYAALEFRPVQMKEREG